MAHINALLLRTGIALIIGVVASQQRTSQLHEFRRKVLVLLHEICHLPEAVDTKAIRNAIIEEFSNEFEIVFLNNEDTCTNNLLVRTILMKEMEDEQTIAVIGSTEPFLCDTISKLTDANKKLFISWNCPQVGKQDNVVHYPVQPHTVRLLPPVRDVVGAMLSLFKHFRWKRAAIVTVVRPIVLCVSEYSRTYANVVRVLSKLQPIVPIIVMRLSSNFYDYYADMTTTTTTTTSGTSTNFQQTTSSGGHMSLEANYDYIRGSCASDVVDDERSTFDWGKKDADKATAEDAKIDNVSTNATVMTTTATDESLKYQFLFVSPYTKVYQQGWFSMLLKTSATIIRDYELLEKSTDRSKLLHAMKLETQFLLSDLVDSNSSRRQILTLYRNRSASCVPAITDLYSVEELLSPPVGPEWFQSKLNMKYNRKYNPPSNCLFCEGRSFEISWELFLLGMLIVLIVIVLLCGIIFLIRQYVNRRRLKDPCKILLTSEDIVFPQLSESKKVQERIGAVLCCCYIRELDAFDGPEVDKPDLLKGPDDSVNSFPLKNVNSCTSVSKPISSTEIKARYNGDLVQLKDIPVHAGGSFELRSKSLNVLMMIHGLRHENLNPLIGLMADPVRPALVWEYCSRGSLEDVLMQDEIKLDWSFRLSLLTDLVRGMKYLHSYPYRVHGSLTSRNCVIDARWVLKITDYSLAEFYNSQGITDSRTKARDLLWTAPELLRDRSLMRKGSQQGDIYSFAIIMQEVVVRGEPFCMLALKPEDIIEKLKTPPPLIRPSVSKGAAPPEAINIMRQCWAEQPEKRPDFNAIYDLFKTLNHGRKINFVDTMFQMLEKYSNNLEDLIRERTEQLDMEKKKTEQLLNRMLPYSVAEKLKLGMHVDPEEFSEVTIYFSDIVGFTTISAYSTPFEVVDLLNDLYTCFDDTINAYNVYKVETIGDAYMVVGGLPVCIPDHADQIATMALDLLHQSGQFKIRHLPSTPLRLRIGLHTGPCCAGVVGLTMPRYCLFGDTVNTASRLESTGSPGRIHISEATKLKLDLVGAYKLEYRGETELKGKGKMPTYWLLGKDGFDKDIPEPPPITENHGLDEELIRRCSSRYRHSNALTKHPSESSVEQESVATTSCTHSRQLVLQKSLDSGLPGEMCPSRTQKGWMTRRQMTFDLSDQRTYEHAGGGFVQKMQLIPEMAANGKALLHSEASTPHSTSDKSIDLVGVSTIGSKSGSVRHRKYADAENDLSKPYNYYRCLLPPDTAANSQPTCSLSSSSKFVSKFLKRQFSVDKSDDAAIVLQELPIAKSGGRLSKQNSAGGNHEGAASDKTDKSQIFKLNNNNNNNNNNDNSSSNNNKVPAIVSVSNESLS